MPSPSAVFWIDSANNRLLSGWNSITTATTPTFKQGDTIGVELHMVGIFEGGGIAETKFPDSVTMTMALGRIDTSPSSGYFTLSYGGQTTASIPYDADATVIQTKLNALSTITADGGVVVTKTNTLFKIIWNTSGVLTNTLAVADNELFPSSTIGNTVLKAGAVGVKQVVQLHIKQAPIANVTSFTTQDLATATVTALHTPAFSGDMSVWRVAISPAPKDGTFILSFNDGFTTYRTSPISINANVNDMKSALKAARDESWYVVKSGVYSWDISTQVGSVYNMTVSGSGIVSFNSKYGILSLNTAEVEDFLAGSASGTATLEIQMVTGETTTTLVQTTCNIINNLIDTDSYDIVSFGSVMPVDSVVRYDTSQSLSTAQKNTARANIGAMGVADVSSMGDQIASLQGQVIALNSTTISANQLAALNAATTLSSSDAVVATSVLNSGLAGKAPTTHTHTIANVTGLQAAINGKSDIGHTHAIGDVTGLVPALSGKSDTNHTHTNLPSNDQKAAMNAASSPSLGNPFVTLSQVSPWTTASFESIATAVDTDSNGSVDRWAVIANYVNISLEAGVYEFICGQYPNQLVEYTTDVSSGSPTWTAAQPTGTEGMNFNITYTQNSRNLLLTRTNSVYPYYGTNITVVEPKRVVLALNEATTASFVAFLDAEAQDFGYGVTYLLTKYLNPAPLTYGQSLSSQMNQAIRMKCFYAYRKIG